MIYLGLTSSLSSIGRSISSRSSPNLCFETFSLCIATGCHDGSTEIENVGTRQCLNSCLSTKLEIAYHTTEELFIIYVFFFFPFKIEQKCIFSYLF
jgi:hypothetical protein